MTSLDPLKTMIVLAVLALLAWPGLAFGGEPLVHDGMTKQQLGAFAGHQGWQADTSGSGNDVTIRAGDRSAHVTMMDCDDGGSCRSGLIRDQSYYFIKTPGGACSLWHWNLEANGATGFGPNYVTLQRYLRFHGVTDQYLKDAIDAYLDASPSFWTLVEACAQSDR